MRVWAIHQALRSDLGLTHPAWPNEIERERRKQLAATASDVQRRVETAVHIVHGAYGELRPRWLRYRTFGPFTIDRAFLGLILDMDGLMIDSEVVERQGWRLAARQFGYELSDELFAQLVGRTAADTDRILVTTWQRQSSSDVDIRAIREAKVAHVLEQRIEQKPGISELLAWSQTHRVPTAVASSSARAVVIERLRAAGIDVDSIDVIVGGDEVTSGKPAPDAFLLAAERLHVAPEDCLVLEDSASGLAAAHAARALPVAVPDKSVAVGPPTSPPDEAFARFDSLTDVLVAIESANPTSSHARHVVWRRWRIQRPTSKCVYWCV